MCGPSQGVTRFGLVAMAVAAAIGLTVVACAYLGQFLDQRLGTSPWMTLAGALLGLVAAAVESLLVIQRMEARKSGPGCG